MFVEQPQDSPGSAYQDYVTQHGVQAPYKESDQSCRIIFLIETQFKDIQLDLSGQYYPACCPSHE